jgi:hypothetical protein
VDPHPSSGNARAGPPVYHCYGDMPDQTGQVHANLMREVADEIAEEAKRRGVQQGV